MSSVPSGPLSHLGYSKAVLFFNVQSCKGYKSVEIIIEVSSLTTLDETTFPDNHKAFGRQGSHTV
jgi:hypothetical protein